MAEWLKAAVSKAVEPLCSGGSNPSPSAELPFHQRTEEFGRVLGWLSAVALFVMAVTGNLGLLFYSPIL